MEENGFEVIALSANQKELQEVREREGIKTFAIPLSRVVNFKNDLKALYYLIRVISRLKPEIVHTHTPKAGVIGMLAAFICRVPIRLHTLGGIPWMTMTGKTRIFMRIADFITYFCAHRVYPNSKALLAFINKDRPMFRSKFFLLGDGSSNGIDTEYFKPTTELVAQAQIIRNQNLPEATFVWGFTGRIDNEKGIRELYDAFKRIQLLGGKHQLVIVGPIEQVRLGLDKNITHKIQNDPDVYLTGFQNDVRPFLLMMDAFVFPSYREGLSNIVLEAGALEIPILASDIIGCNEIVTHRNSGLLFEPQNSEAVYQAMMEIFADLNLAKTYGKQLRTEIVEKYSREKIWHLILQQYQQLMAARK